MMGSASAVKPKGLLHRRCFVDGSFVDAGNSFDLINPANGSVYGKAYEADAQIVDHAVRSAKTALGGEWAQLGLQRRRELLHAVATGIEARFDEFLEAEILDTGKPEALASHLDIPRGAANFRIFADAVANVSTECFHMDTPDGKGAINYANRKPLGVIAVVCPWNLPLLLMTWKVAPALACGNTVVVKPSEFTPSTATLLAEVMRDAGVPQGVFNVVHGFGAESAGQLLTSHPGIDGITFTGGTSTGSAIQRAAASGVKDISLELGGKNPAIVFADTDLDASMFDLARSAFANAGQVCLAPERFYVQRPLYEEFVKRMQQAAEALQPGLPYAKGTTLGPLISEAHRTKVTDYMRLAVIEGAQVITGGGISEFGDERDGGYYVQPTIWTGLAESARCMKEEVFGPVCHITPFDTEEEAINMANDSVYGLAATVWTRDLTCAHRVSAALETGIVWVNCWFLRDLRTPFGGSKQSGIGREGGLHSLAFYTELSNVCIKL